MACGTGDSGDIAIGRLRSQFCQFEGAGDGSPGGERTDWMRELDDDIVLVHRLKEMPGKGEAIRHFLGSQEHGPQRQSSSFCNYGVVRTGVDTCFLDRCIRDFIVEI